MHELRNCSKALPISVPAQLKRPALFVECTERRIFSFVMEVPLLTQLEWFGEVCGEFVGHGGVADDGSGDGRP